jgi:hypothetical protein
MQSIARSPVMAVGLIVGLVIGASEVAAGGSPIRILLGAGIPIGYAVIVALLGRRSETASVLAGRPVDERWMQFNLNASAWALGVSAVVVIAAFVVVQASGGDYLPYAFIGAVMGIAYIGSLMLIRLRD